MFFTRRKFAKRNIVSARGSAGVATLTKNRKWPTARFGGKGPKKGFGVIFYLFAIFGSFVCSGKKNKCDSGLRLNILHPQNAATWSGPREKREYTTTMAPLSQSKQAIVNTMSWGKQLWCIPSPWKNKRKGHHSSGKGMRHTGPRPEKNNGFHGGGVYFLLPYGHQAFCGCPLRLLLTTSWTSFFPFLCPSHPSHSRSSLFKVSSCSDLRTLFLEEMQPSGLVCGEGVKVGCDTEHKRHFVIKWCAKT